jgi:hypothetical protein
LLLLTATSALAAEGVLVSDIPPGKSPAAILDAAHRALIHRNWTILHSDPTSLDANLKQKGSDSTLTVFVSDGILKYRGAAKVPQIWGAGKDAKWITVDGRIPESALDDLRADIKQYLVADVPHGNAVATTHSTPPATASPSNAGTGQGAAAPSTPAGKQAAPALSGSTRDKLKELEQLRKEGLITEPEYQQMRKGVLDAF